MLLYTVRTLTIEERRNTNDQCTRDELIYFTNSE